MSATDSLLARYQGEIEERQSFIDQVVEDAEKNERDLTAQELEMIGRTRDRIQAINQQVDPLRQAAEIAHQSRKRTEEIAEQFRGARGPEPVLPEYRSAGAYVLDRWRAGLGMEEAINKIDLFHRAAAHQTTGDNAGLLPEQILGPVINFIDESRPLVSALGPRQLPSGSWSRPIVTQHTQVDVQSSEKTELASRKMTIEKLPVDADTYGGYVNVSRQNIDWTQPQIMDIIIGDLAGQYAIQTEAATAAALEGAATSGTGGLGTTPTAAEVSAALWDAAASVYTAMPGGGRLICVAAPDMLGLIGPLFAPVNPANAQSSGFSAGSFGSGIVGAVSGIQIIVSGAVTAGTALVLSTAAAEVYEDRIGALQVVEPSVLGVQVAYAGYFAPLVISGDAIISLTSA